jgi:low affinity Fe/Cu permease
VAIWFMTLLITRTEHRDTEAIQAKLDELLRIHGEARDELTAIDEKEVEEIAAHRAKERENDVLSTANAPNEPIIIQQVVDGTPGDNRP